MTHYDLLISYQQWDGGGSKKKQEIALDDSLEPWDMRRSAILSKFTTSDKLSMVSSYLSGGEKGKQNDTLISHQK